MKALQRAVDSGITLAIATGRGADQTLDLAERVGLFSYCVTGNGSQTTLLRRGDVSGEGREVVAKESGGP